MFNRVDPLVYLKNGKTVRSSVVNTTIMALDDIAKKSPDFISEITKKCLDFSYEMTEEARKISEAFALTQGGVIHNVTKDIILSATNNGTSNIVSWPLASIGEMMAMKPSGLRM